MRVACSRSRLFVTMAWVRLSSALVASSQMMMAGFTARARAMRIRCRCPPEILVLPSLTKVCICMGISRISSAMPAASAAAQASSIVRSLTPTIL